MPAISVLIPILQYGIPAGIEGIRFLQELIEKMNNKAMTQDEFNEEWHQMQVRYKAAGHAWETAGQ